MKKLQKMSKNRLIPLLINYKKLTNCVFPIEKLAYLSTDEIIQRLEDCIRENKVYQLKLYKFNDDRKVQMEDENIKVVSLEEHPIISLIKLSMDSINYDYSSDINEILDIIDLRNNGKEFTFSEHIRAMIIVLLSNHRWGDKNIRENMYKIDAIFHHYDKNYLKNVDPSILVSELRKIHCANPMLTKQMKSLSYNISVFEKIEQEYGSLDNFVLSNSPNDIANLFYAGKYNLKQIGRSNTFDYLKRVGINTCKSSSSIERLFGYNRLALVKNAVATEGQTLLLIKQLSIINNISEIEIESILNQFCLLRSANICGETPKCEKCKLRRICRNICKINKQ